MSKAIFLKANKPEVVWQTYDDEIVLINLKNGNYYSICGSGYHVWNLLKTGSMLSDIIRNIGKIYRNKGVDIEEILNRFIETLLKEELICSVEQDNPDEKGNLIVPSEKISPEILPEFELPKFSKYSDMQDLILLDPVHEVDESGWPNQKNEK